MSDREPTRWHVICMYYICSSWGQLQSAIAIRTINAKYPNGLNISGFVYFKYMSISYKAWVKKNEASAYYHDLPSIY